MVVPAAARRTSLWVGAPSTWRTTADIAALSTVP
jgi:hypothetical protein